MLPIAGITRENQSEVSEKASGGNIFEEDLHSTKNNVVPGESSQHTASLHFQDDIDLQNKKFALGKWVHSKRRKIDETDPYPQNPLLRKFYSHNEKSLPKELRDLFTALQCNLCNCSMSSTVTAKDHYEGKKHISNIKKWLFEHPEFNNQYNISEPNQPKIVAPEKLYCKYCDLMLSSEQQAQSHYLGKRHRSVIHNGLMKNTFYNYQTGQWEKCEPIVDDGHYGIGSSFTNKNETLGESTSNQKYFCNICQVACTSQVNFGKHVAGAKHQKRIHLLQSSNPPPVAQDNILEDVIKNDKMIASTTDLSIYRTPSGKYYCFSCNVTVNSPTQFLQHSESRKHKHKFSKQVK